MLNMKNRDIIASDLFRYGGLEGNLGFLKAMFIPCFKFTYFFRKSSSSKKGYPKWLFYNLILRRYTIKYGIQIPANTNIGHGFYIGHFGTIVINGKVNIVNNCNISHNVTIGQTNRGKKRRSSNTE